MKTMMNHRHFQHLLNRLLETKEVDPYSAVTIVERVRQGAVVGGTPLLVPSKMLLTDYTKKINRESIEAVLTLIAVSYPYSSVTCKFKSIKEIADRKALQNAVRLEYLSVLTKNLIPIYDWDIVKDEDEITILLGENMSQKYVVPVYFIELPTIPISVFTGIVATKKLKKEFNSAVVKKLKEIGLEFKIKDNKKYALEFLTDFQSARDLAKTVKDKVKSSTSFEISTIGLTEVINSLSRLKESLEANSGGAVLN